MGHRPITAAKGEMLPAEVVRAAQEGDRQAQSELIRLTQNDLYRFCFYLCGQAALAQELTQDTYVHVLEKLDHLEDVASFKSWLFRSAKNLFLDHIKSRKNEAKVDIHDLDEKLEVEGNDPDLVLSVRDALAALKPDDRLVLLLVDLEKYSYAEAGHIMGISEQAVTARVFRARQAFQENFRK